MDALLKIEAFNLQRLEVTCRAKHAEQLIRLSPCRRQRAAAVQAEQAELRICKLSFGLLSTRRASHMHVLSEAARFDS